MINAPTLTPLLLALATMLAAQTTARAREGDFNRTVLPIPEPDYPRSTVLDARDAEAEASGCAAYFRKTDPGDGVRSVIRRLAA